MPRSNLPTHPSLAQPSHLTIRQSNEKGEPQVPERGVHRSRGQPESPGVLKLQGGAPVGSTAWLGHNLMINLQNIRRNISRTVNRHRKR
jgi:hypothetical protein